MNRKMKKWLILAACFVGLGTILFAGLMSLLGWDFSKLSTAKKITNVYEIYEDFQDISVIVDTADVVFVPSEDGECSVSCYEREKVKHFVAVEDGTLVVRVQDSRKWYEHIGIFFGTPKITVSIPEGQYGNLTVRGDTGDVDIGNAFAFKSMELIGSTGDVSCGASAQETIKIKCSTGNICVNGSSAGAMGLITSTGKITVSNVVCREEMQVDVNTGKTELMNVRCEILRSVGDTGDILLKDVIAEKFLLVERSTGDVKFDGSDAGEITIKTDTGDVKGNLLTEKVFMAYTDTGRVDVPKTVTGGKCEITTDTGNILLSIQAS